MHTIPRKFNSVRQSNFLPLEDIPSIPLQLRLMHKRSRLRTILLRPVFVLLRRRRLRQLIDFPRPHTPQARSRAYIHKSAEPSVSSEHGHISHTHNSYIRIDREETHNCAPRYLPRRDLQGNGLAKRRRQREDQIVQTQSARQILQPQHLGRDWCDGGPSTSPPPCRRSARRR